jgi:hypothetical protein
MLASAQEGPKAAEVPNQGAGLASPDLTRALEFAKTLPESAHLAEVEEDLARLEAISGQFREAAQIMGDVIVIEGRTLGVDDPRIALSLKTYSEYSAKINQKTQARQAQQRRQQIRRTTF